MPIKSTKTATAKSAKKSTAKATPKTSARKATSKKGNTSAQEQAQRTVYVAGVVVVTAALIAISAGFSTYQKHVNQIGASQSGGQGTLFLQSLDSKGAAVGSTVSVALYENSGSEPVNTVQSDIQYPADRLELINVKTGEAFPQEAATDTTTPGLVRIARSVNVRTPAIKGAKPVATMEFKVLQNSGTPIQLGINQATSFLVRSTDNKNILHVSATKSYELTQ